MTDARGHATARVRRLGARTAAPPAGSAPSGLVVNSPWSRHCHAAHTGLDVLYECAGCGDRLLNVQRCESCHRFARRLGVAVTCPTCDESILLSELLEHLP
jgi:hypothetical protein